MGILLLTIATAETTTQTQTSETTPSPTTTNDERVLCLDLNKITLNGAPWPSRMNSKESGTKGIFYVYNAEDSLNTFKSFTFPMTESWPTSFTFGSDESSVGCWDDAHFADLNIQFKVYQFYHTALKAVSSISVPNNTTRFNLALNALPYQYSNVNVTVECTFKWSEEDVLPLDQGAYMIKLEFKDTMSTAVILCAFLVLIICVPIGMVWITMKCCYSNKVQHRAKVDVFSESEVDAPLKNDDVQL